MTNKIYLFTLFMASSLFAIEIPEEHAQERLFATSIELNAQVIQLSNSSQSVTTQISGHLEKYYVEAGQKVKAGQKIALIESLSVSKMTANFISLRKQYGALEKNYQATKKLYDNGMTSMQELNNQSIQKNAMLAEINSLRSQLKTLNINTKNLKVASPNFTLYAHSAGKVSQLLLPLHTIVGIDEGVINIVKEQAFYLKSFVPLQYASKVKVGQKILITYNGRNITTHVKQILPSVDAATQRIVVLSSIDEITDDLYINAYVKSTLYFEVNKKYVAVKKSALSFFNNEWVIFVPKEEQVNLEPHNESNHVSEVKSHEDGEAEEHQEEEHEEHEEVESSYEARVVKIVAHDDEYVGVLGLEVNEEYVSGKSYYVKSMMLKSSLGEHGH